MTNEEKYQTGDEQFIAWVKFCDQNGAEDCTGCQICEEMHTNGTSCFAHWLQLEAPQNIARLTICGRLYRWLRKIIQTVVTP